MAITDMTTASDMRKAELENLDGDSDDDLKRQGEKNNIEQSMRKRKTIEVDPLSSASFWAPHEITKYTSEKAMSEGPQRKNDHVAKTFVPKCPMSNTPLRLKDLIPVKPKINKADESNEIRCGVGKWYQYLIYGCTCTVVCINLLSNSKINSPVHRWLCDVSDKELSHHSVLLVIDTGQLVLEEVFKNILFGTVMPTTVNPKKRKKKIEKNDHRSDNTITADLDPKDYGRKDTGHLYSFNSVVRMRPGETIFAAHNRVEGKIFRPTFG